MSKRHLSKSEETGARSILDAVAGPAWERPRVTRYAADEMDRGSLRILAGETPIDQKPGDGGDDSDAAY